MFSTPLHIGIYRFKEDKQEFTITSTCHIYSYDCKKS